MVVPINKLIVVILFFLTGISAAAEIPVSYPVYDSVSNKQPVSNHRAAHSGMRWQILPGENIRQIASLMFPKDSIVRHQLIRAIIRANPEHFPDGTYQPLPSGTIIHIPDLRTIGAYSKSSIKTRKPAPTNHVANKGSPANPETTNPDLNSHLLELQLLNQLQQVAENELRESNSLTKKIEFLESRLAEINSWYSLRVQEQYKQPIDHSDTLQETTIPVLHNLTTANENNPTPVENQVSFDTVFILGILFTVLIIAVVLRYYRKIQERLTQSSHSPLLSGVEAADHHYYDVLTSSQSNTEVRPLEKNLSYENNQIASEASLLVKQDNPEAAVQLLQKQLSINQLDLPGWILLFQLLYHLGNKTDFKKNARRFKRLGEFPDVWIQVQNLGHRLEPDEPLYFDEQKRQEKFFPDLSGAS